MLNHRLTRRAAFSALFWTLWMPAAPTAGESEPSLRITVTVAPLVWLVSEVAGSDVVVEHLVDDGDIPETFQPTDLRITGVARSDLFFRVGVPAENGPWLRALQGSGRTKVVDLRQGVTLRAMASHHHEDEQHRGTDEAEPHGHGTHTHGMDPHIWLSPRRLEIMARTIASSLAEIDPRRADQYAERTAGLTTRLRALDAELMDRLAPLQGHAFFIFHPAWGYFADDYGLRQVAIEIAGKEPTEEELTRLVREARALGIRAIFVQPQIRSATPQTIARAIGAKVETLDPLAADLPANLRRAAERLLAVLPSAEGGP